MVMVGLLQEFRPNTLDGRSATDLKELQTGELAQAIRELGAAGQVIHR